MSTLSNACSCPACPGADCNCGCQPAAARPMSCECGDVCHGGPTCDCEGCQHTSARQAERR